MEAPAAEEAAAAPKARGPTRFDRLKQLYKGPRPSINSEGLDFSYDDFEWFIGLELHCFSLGTFNLPMDASRV